MSTSDMEVVYAPCRGIEIHRKLVTDCFITPKEKVIRTFCTMTRSLLESLDFMKNHECIQVTMG